ncbi:MAG: hypothetical protein HY259_11700 [Chloroflexi bacterium]|nr:hypothetical protein [Chloroflexota bacterium]MBI3734099.1 hypothetical protein [Chloroflexota bacterium]
MITGPPPAMPINSVESAIRLARRLLRDALVNDPQLRRSYRVFRALTHSEQEALAALLIWRARGKLRRARLALQSKHAPIAVPPLPSPP